MNTLTLLLTNLWFHLPRFADETGNLCFGAGDCTSTGQQPSKSDLSSPLTGHVSAITNTLLYVAGAVAVIIIIIGGIRYVTSTGDATRIKSAKDTLLYAVIGLVVVIAAYAVVHFVANNV